MATLAEYKRKRDFHITSEPAGRVEPRRGHSFVIQKHDATRLHYDFRLELDGVLKSWAVPKGPSLDPSVKRLAVEVEDHPLSYASFEGTIPKGEYGGGAVLVWDRGSWTPEGDPHEGLRKGHLRFSLDGEKLHGTWNLIRSHGRSGKASGRSQWLLIKSHDAEARPESEYDIEMEHPESVITGVQIDEVAANVDAKGRLRMSQSGSSRKKNGAPSDTTKKEAPRADVLPEFIAPQLAVLVSEPPAGADYLYETKFDGYRALARLDGRGRTPDVRVYTRSGNDWTERFAAIAEAVASLDVETAYLDGEIVAFGDDEKIDFQTLQSSLGEGNAHLFYYVFDLLFLNGHDLRRLPLGSRKELLEQLVRSNPHPLIRYSQHWTGDSRAFLKEACSKHLEGMVCKDSRKPYVSGRTADWLKVKCTNRQELIIVGYTPPQRSREHLGSLLVASHDPDGRLRYMGRVGTGYTRKTLRELKERLEPLKTDAPPVYNPERARGITWVKPRLVAEIEYGHLTQDKLLRHAAFRGLREDKPASQVVIEVPDTQARSLRDRGTKRGASEGASEVVITHPDKILFPPDGPTKLELAEYYEQVAERMWPYVQHRPLSLLRCPEGRKKECFFQKHLHGAAAAPGLGAIELTEKEAARPYRYLEAPIGLRSLVQLGALEIHIWGSRIEADDHPVELVFDLDPAPDVEWKRVVKGTRMLKELLERLGLQSFLKLSGGKGVHLHVPIAPRYSFERAKAFCHAVARQLAEEHPELFTSTPSKAERTGRIFIDYLRNGRGATFIAPFSARAREGATLAVPVAWEALGGRTRPDRYTVRTIKNYLKEYPRDPWEGSWNLAQTLAVLEASV